MEWVETTGRSVEEAKEVALDELGVDEADAEFEVLAEAQTGLFGRLRSEARIRARVRPTAPRPKDDRRDRRRRSAAANNSARGSGTEDLHSRMPSADRPFAEAELARQPTGKAQVADGPGREKGRAPGRLKRTNKSGSEPHRDSEAQGDEGSDLSLRSSAVPGEHVQPSVTPTKGTQVEVPLDQQARVAQEFLDGLVKQFGYEAQTTVTPGDDDSVEVAVDGSDLGLLIGSRGATLAAVQTLTRTVVVHRTGATNGRLHVDIGGYRKKRTEALVRFARRVAEEVRNSGERTALEPMPAADRKVVHDAIAPLAGVTTVSEGEEPERRVVVVPDPGKAD